MKKETILAQAGSWWDESTGAVTMPVYQTATFRHPALGQSTGYDYSRSANPTRQALEQTLAELDGGRRGFAFASGLAAIDAVMRIFSPGDRVLLTEDLYGGTYRLFEKFYGPVGIEFQCVDTSSPEEVERAWDERVKALFIEIPTNPLLKVADVRGLAALARGRGALTIVDNTFLTPVALRPLELGADLAVYSASKYLSGHNDVVAGAVVAADEELAERIYFNQNATGAVLGPQDSWLVLRGLKTLSVRLERQQANAARVADFLLSHPGVAAVHYPGLVNHPGHGLLASQADGFGAMISFEVNEAEAVERLLASVEVFSFAESLGGVESLITYPKVQTHADICEDELERLGINDRLLRLSIGIENVEDLIADLDRALKG